MKGWRKLPLAFALAATACGGDAGSDTGDVGNDGSDAGIVDESGYDSGFGSDDLPGGFPDELLPPAFTAGKFVEFAGRQVVSFRSDLSFDAAVDHYDGVLGEGVVVSGDPGQRLAQWTEGPGWAVVVLEGEPIEINLTRLPE